MSASTNIQVAVRTPWWEILLVMFISLGITLVSPDLKLIALLIPIVYLAVEKRLRQRTWADLGVSFRDIPAGLRQNLGWILLVAVVIQALAAFGSYTLLPEYFQHILARLPVEVSALSVSLLIALGISTLGEEILYRALFQGRIQAFLPAWAAIVLTSLVFALMHYSAGPVLIVFVDLFNVFIDSLIFGIIFLRSGNVFVAWIAHFLGDIVGLIFLMMMK